MAITTCSCLSPTVLLQKSCLVSKPVCRFLMLKTSSSSDQVSVKKSRKLQIRSSFQDKVFEDQSNGIICYRDVLTGEMICEGLDEGPRILTQTARATYNQRDAEIIELLQQNWLQIAKSDEFGYTDRSISAQEDFNNWNGFNRFC